MEDRVVIRDNGREIDASDINTLGESGALADDRVFAELLRMSSYVDGVGAARGILPYAEAGHAGATVQPSVEAARALTVKPFRAFIAAREELGGDGQKSWRDIRSCLSPMSYLMEHSLELAENGLSDPRWDLIYAAVQVDVDVEATRFAKALDTDDVTAAPYVTKQVTSMTIVVAAGDAAVDPTKPSPPADAGGIYNIPLAYVLVVPGAMAFTNANIMEVAPILALAPSTSANVTRPATAVSTHNGPLLSHIPWDLTGASRPGPWLPPSMVGGVSLIIPIQLATGLTASVANGDVIDEMTDWRKRFFRWWVYAQTGSGAHIASDPVQSAPPVPSANGSILGQTVKVGLGQSFVAEATPSGVPGGLTVVWLTEMNLTALGDDFGLYVDAASGALKAYVESSGGGAAAQIFIWLDATAQFPGA